MSERRKNERRSSRNNRVDPFMYAMYRPDDEDPEQIEELFNQLDQRIQDAEGKGTDDIARQMFKETAAPNQVPLDVWFSFEKEADTGDKDDDAAFTPGSWEDGDDFVARRHTSGTRQKRSSSSKPKVILIAASQQIEHLGAGVDLWPLYKVQQLDVFPQLKYIHDYPNREMLSSRNKISEVLKHNPINIVDRITAKVIQNIVGEHCDAIIMDPPFGFNDWTHDRFLKLLLNLGRYLTRTFIVVWADPENMGLIQDVFDKTEYVFCDSIAVELLDQSGGPYYSPPSELGFRRESRMAVMFRTDDINRSDLKQQRVKDTGFGTVYENGKSYGRIGLPLSIHEIMEIMLPDLPNRKRTFVELWPSFFTRRSGWINIDERANPNEEVKDEIVHDEEIQTSTDDNENSVGKVIKFDDTLINKLIDLDDGKPRRKIAQKDEHQDIAAVIIQNGIDDQDDDIDISEIERRKEQRSQQPNPKEAIHDYSASQSSDDDGE
ncbi:hypothetical protein TRFO_13101 [Tritrichomonas foetus]|uniref:Uncharacterized protein n=1 Tax=Tritrichomonas foetus TaxID=1144522 RepID=A0A1J4L3H3_9EUKA|nr:hypothetical protein TRFO_13101 [Tritrichomonas foetus]|eukprot:OHT16524.1 hypothetical protein TRFO_13101 [Tritrichomonas foetus]